MRATQVGRESTGLYMLYYAIFEYDHENKGIILLTSFAGGAIASLLMSMAA
ncbi:MAG: hypothetical protein IT206_07175 [Fimbriimonadaceae bacterium]|nr:hypothetical protein [Fimbriimonadaceae bacterium]